MADNQSIPLGLCGCGCGHETRPARRNRYDEGILKGRPRRFLKGHHHRKPLPFGVTMQAGYVAVSRPGHPRADRDGYVPEHIVVVEAVLGKFVAHGHPIHHVNTDRADNRNCNLVVLESDSDHIELHRKMRVLAAGGNPWTDHRCFTCKEYKHRSCFWTQRNGRVYPYCRDCMIPKGKARRLIARESAVGVVEK